MDGRPGGASISWTAPVHTHAEKASKCFAGTDSVVLHKQIIEQFPQFAGVEISCGISVALESKPSE